MKVSWETLSDRVPTIKCINYTLGCLFTLENRMRECFEEINDLWLESSDYYHSAGSVDRFRLAPSIFSPRSGANDPEPRASPHQLSLWVASIWFYCRWRSILFTIRILIVHRWIRDGRRDHVDQLITIWCELWLLCNFVVGPIKNEIKSGDITTRPWKCFASSVCLSVYQPAIGKVELGMKLWWRPEK